MPDILPPVFVLREKTEDNDYRYGAFYYFKP